MASFATTVSNTNPPPCKSKKTLFRLVFQTVPERPDLSDSGGGLLLYRNLENGAR